MTNMPSLLKTVCAQKLEASLYQYQFIEELHLYFGLFFLYHYILYFWAAYVAWWNLWSTSRSPSTIEEELLSFWWCCAMSMPQVVYQLVTRYIPVPMTALSWGLLSLLSECTGSNGSSTRTNSPSPPLAKGKNYSLFTIIS